MKWSLLLGNKAMTNLDSILKSKDITDKGPSSQSYLMQRAGSLKKTLMLERWKE